MSTKYLVAVYMVDKAYGGPEEGGWWYDTGELIRIIDVFGHEQKAYDFCLRLNKLLRRTLNKGRREISSVLSTGRYFAEVYEDCAPRHYPEITPHYE